MNKRLAVVAGVVLVVAVGIAVFGSRKRAASHPAASPSSSAESSHGVGMDRAMSAALAMYEAPQGATPCESAYLAFQASVDFARTHGATPIVETLAPRDQFLAKCAAQPPAVQQCLVPAYLAHHRDECEKVKPPADVLASMVVMKQVIEPPKP